MNTSSGSSFFSQSTLSSYPPLIGGYLDIKGFQSYVGDQKISPEHIPCLFFYYGLTRESVRYVYSKTANLGSTTHIPAHFRFPVEAGPDIFKLLLMEKPLEITFTHSNINKTVTPFMIVTMTGNVESVHFLSTQSEQFPIDVPNASFEFPIYMIFQYTLVDFQIKTSTGTLTFDNNLLATGKTEGGGSA